MSNVHRLLDPARDGNTDYAAYPPPRQSDPSSARQLPGGVKTYSTTAPAASAYPPYASSSTRHMSVAASSVAPSSVHSSGSQAGGSIPLPSMRTIDTLTQQPQHATRDTGSGMGINLPPPSTQPPTAYYYHGNDPSAHHHPPLPAGYSHHPESLARYVLPPDPRSQYRAPKKVC
jgi:hypothetical protein